MSTIQIKIEELNTLRPEDIADSTNVERKFVEMYNAIWNTNEGEQVYAREKYHFNRILADNPNLRMCSKISLLGCFLDIAVSGLSLDQSGRPHCYIIPKTVKTGYKDQSQKDIYESRASLSISGYGELTMRMRAGQIKYADNPVVVYEGDTFRVTLVNGVKNIEYSAQCPRNSNKVIAAFIRIVRNDGSVDYQWLMQGDIERLKKYSSNANSRYDQQSRQRVAGNPNALYTSNDGCIDPGFLENKMIKHAFDAYPKVRTGQYTIMETQQEEAFDYGIGAEPDPRSAIAENSNAKAGSFAEPTDQPEPAKVVITPEDEEAGF